MHSDVSAASHVLGLVRSVLARGCVTRKTHAGNGGEQT